MGSRTYKLIQTHTHVVEKSEDGGEGEGDGEHGDVAELDEDLDVLLRHLVGARGALFGLFLVGREGVCWWVRVFKGGGVCAVFLVCFFVGREGVCVGVGV